MNRSHKVIWKFKARKYTLYKKNKNLLKSIMQNKKRYKNNKIRIINMIINLSQVTANRIWNEILIILFKIKHSLTIQ